MALQDMIDAAPEEIAAIDASLVGIDEQIVINQQKIVDLTDEAMIPSVNDLQAQLVVKTPPDYSYPNPDYPTEPHDTIYVTYNRVYGPTFNTDNIIDWAITESTADGDDSATINVYVYEGVGWDSDAIITNAVIQWDFAYDYINHPMGLTGTYGLLGMIDALNQGTVILTTNKDTLETLLLLNP